MYSNPLIYGKDDTMNVVSVEPGDKSLTIFTETEDGIHKQTIENEIWLLTNRCVSSKQLTLNGNQYYKYVGLFSNQEEFKNVKSNLYRRKVDFYTINDLKENALVANGMTYYKGMKPNEVSVLFFDIESMGLVHDNNSAVLLISNTYRKKDKIIKKLFAYDEYSSQAELLNAWSSWVREMDPSILCGHNIFSYDLPYMNFCAQQSGTELLLGRDGSAIKFNDYTSQYRKDGSQSYDYHNAFVFGREIVDTFFLSMKYDIGRKYESYGLKSIIKYEKLEKADRQFYDAGKIKDNFKNPEEWTKIKAYAMDDADDAMALFDLMIPSYFYFTQSVSKTFQQMINSATGSQINNMMVRAYLQDGNSIAKSSDATEFEGAVSFGIPGIYKNCFKVDVASLYPSIMREYKVYDKYKDPNKYFLEMVEYFTLERLKNKKLAKDTGDKFYKDLEQSQKIAINSMYGFMGASGLNYNSPSNASLVTRKGREILIKSIEFATGKSVDYWKSLGANNE